MLLLAAMLLPAARARADLYQQQADAAWRQADLCARESFKKFPDHTPDGNARREPARRACLRNHKLPVPVAAPQAGGAPPNGDKP